MESHPSFLSEPSIVLSPCLEESLVVFQSSDGQPQAAGLEAWEVRAVADEDAAFFETGDDAARVVRAFQPHEDEVHARRQDAEGARERRDGQIGRAHV